MKKKIILQKINKFQKNTMTENIGIQITNFGDDFLEGGSGRDLLTGGDGSDFFHVLKKDKIGLRHADRISDFNLGGSGLVDQHSGHHHHHAGLRGNHAKDLRRHAPGASRVSCQPGAQAVAGTVGATGVDG